MGFYIGTTQTCSIRINYLYRCSRCGRAIAQNTFVQGSGFHYSGIGEEKAKRSAREKSVDNLKEAVEAAGQGSYKSLNIKTKCPFCSNREPWQMCRFPDWMVALNVFVFPCVLFIFIGLLGNPGKGGMPVLIGAGAICAVLTFLNIRYSVRRTNMEEACRHLEEDKKPFLFFSQEIPEEAKQAIGLKPDETVTLNYHELKK